MSFSVSSKLSITVGRDYEGHILGFLRRRCLPLCMKSLNTHEPINVLYYKTCTGTFGFGIVNKMYNNKKFWLYNNTGGLPSNRWEWYHYKVAISGSTEDDVLLYAIYSMEHEIVKKVEEHIYGNLFIEEENTYGKACSNGSKNENKKFSGTPLSIEDCNDNIHIKSTKVIGVTYSVKVNMNISRLELKSQSVSSISIELPF